MSVARNFEHLGPLRNQIGVTWRRIGSVVAALSTSIALSACGALAFQLTSESLDPFEIGEARVNNVFQTQNSTLLTSGEIYTLLRDSTLISRTIDQPDKLQYGYFGPNGDLIVSGAPGHSMRGTWRLEGQSLCYTTPSGDFCSLAHAVEVVTNGIPRQLYYFSRLPEGRPTVIFVSIMAGNTIPADRL